MSKSPEVVAVDSAYEYEFDVTQKATATGVNQAAPGLASITGYFTLTVGGAALGTTTVTLTERASTAGRYSGICSAANMTAALTAYVNQAAYKAYVIAGFRPVHQPVVFTLSSAPL